ncbi:ester cyclase [Haloferax sp. S1W]|uniref:ester cyclase n=1 Tax=Haloferax sp. S1W TaxID=3377110 RepID=UPI0037C5DF19
MSTTEAENKEIARKLPEEAINEGNLDIIDELVADDYVGRNPAVPEPYHGPDGVKEFVSMVRTAFPDLEYTVEDLIAEGDKVVRRDRATGTHDGEFMGVEPTGKEIEIQGVVIVRIEDGKFAESWSYANMMGLMQQLGVVESPGE